MQNFIKVLVIFCCLSFCSCMAEVTNQAETISKNAYEDYFEEYAQRLYKNYYPEKHFFFGQADVFLFFINNDSSIEHLDNLFKDNRFSRYCKKLILNTPVYPFPQQIKDDKILVAISMSYAYEDRVKVDLGGRTKSRDSFYWKKFYDKPSINVVDIYLEKDCHKK